MFPGFWPESLSGMSEAIDKGERGLQGQGSALMGLCKKTLDMGGGGKVDNRVSCVFPKFEFACRRGQRYRRNMVRQEF